MMISILVFGFVISRHFTINAVGCKNAKGNSSSPSQVRADLFNVK